MKKKEIIKILESITGKYSAYEVFSNWIECTALAISNSCQIEHDEIWQKREEEYLATIKKYNQQEQKKFCEMMALLCECLEEPVDVLGQIYMEAGMGSKAAGQFFTPYHLSKACASLVVSQPDTNGIYRINEPSCGGGGMIIAVAETLKEQGIDYQGKMQVVAQDLDWKGVYMCYVQLSLLGIDAICVQGNTLTEPYAGKYSEERILRTPMNRGVLL